MPRFSFTVPGEPQGKARARTWYDARVGRMASKTPENTVIYENLVKLCYQSAARNYHFPDDTPLRVEIRAYFSIAKRTARKWLPSMAAGLIRPTKKPDVDNITKAVLDALNKVAYKDDSAIVHFSIEKYYSDTPRVEVTIGEWEAPNHE